MGRFVANRCLDEEKQKNRLYAGFAISSTVTSLPSGSQATKYSHRFIASLLDIFDIAFFKRIDSLPPPPSMIGFLFNKKQEF
jgi:hypothetical protein